MTSIHAHPAPKKPTIFAQQFKMYCMEPSPFRLATSKSTYSDGCRGPFPPLCYTLIIYLSIYFPPSRSSFLYEDGKELTPIVSSPFLHLSHFQRPPVDCRYSPLSRKTDIMIRMPHLMCDGRCWDGMCYVYHFLFTYFSPFRV